MFFILSKLIGFFLDPAVWLLLALALMLKTKNRIFRKRMLWGTFIFLVVFTNPFIFNQSMKVWESNIVTKEEIKGTYPVGIVLGGYAYLDRLPETRLHLTPSANRFSEAIQLYKTGKIERILLSGGTTPFSDKLRESEIAKEQMIQIGIPENHIWIDNQSRSTAENGKYSKEVLEKKGFSKNEKILLITSAFHQRRSIAVFQKLGYQVDGYGTDIMQSHTYTYPTYWLQPQVNVLKDWQKIFREVFGLIAYKMKGYI